MESSYNEFQNSVELNIKQMYSFYRRPSEIKTNEQQIFCALLKFITAIILEIAGKIQQRHKRALFLYQKL